ncbi:hypothetical protein D4R52_03100 [bacterium]|nr:MAG: hypothetical protein D4R52_03100 [bacterium]
MSEIDVVKELARETLVIPTQAAYLDNFLWDRAKRLVRNVEHICQVPELGMTGTTIDRFCLTAATYFSDAGIAVRLKTNQAGMLSASDNNGDGVLDFSAQIVEEKLGEHIDGLRVRNISRVITESGNHFSKMPEAMILSDARNLDDMGTVGIFSEFRRYVVGGKSVSDLLPAWEKKIDYRYWQARLEKSFRFESVRKLAEQRLNTAEYFMNQLKIENNANDIAELLAGKL